MKIIWALTFVFVLMIASVAACATPSPQDDRVQDLETEPEHDESENGDAEHEDSDHDDETPERIPNDGAVIRITSPASGATFKAGEDVVVEIETENFTLGEEGAHWEIYVDGASWGSIEGGSTDEVLRGLEQGEHEISVFLSLETHEQLEEGDHLTIVVEE